MLDMIAQTRASTLRTLRNRNAKLTTQTNMFFSFLENELKLNLNLRLCLVSSESWVSCPGHFVLMNTGNPWKFLSSLFHILWRNVCFVSMAARSFNIRVDPRGLSHGAHYAEVTRELLISTYNSVGEGREGMKGALRI